MRVIPAIDIIEGKCVRLTKGEYNTMEVYSRDPLEIAKKFEDHGLNYLHLVDLEGAKQGYIVNYKILEKLSSKTNLQIDFGGGIKSRESLLMAIEAGANQVTIGSLAVNQPDIVNQWIIEFGNQKIIIGADFKNDQISIEGWTESTTNKLIPYINKWSDMGAVYFIVTNIEHDGTLRGPDFETYEKILAKFEINLIASGGISHMDNLYKLKDKGLEGTIVGKAIYEGAISLKDLEKFILETD